ncbi:MAG: DUF2344 domain-containing protein, partial [Proteobacteria bacterium]|nr:DUF2344 domain-containing protein [Pseudomonadota bacterium]MBU1610396.1 DUF2344 domain-containing protein [Pseudomonadota bacterium]
VKRLQNQFPGGIRITHADALSMGRKQPQPDFEAYELRLVGSDEERTAMRLRWEAYVASETFSVVKTTKKGVKSVNLRPLIGQVHIEGDLIRFTADWSENYLSPLFATMEISGAERPDQLALLKTDQSFHPIEL